ncbi:restriction endonuclease subunit S [Intestinimonas butyriciproducens]|uniref:restriction endonuclease subunit S n=1 Tax=Intestinimonas butyriciproducens TaxID=1297617 RepID=UPI00242B9880|nr:restriction endonuclease subunit S [Intestinimonas butyriciproducens]MCI6363978.1 restriction endonuclease subunit S [Intestinimonas butyriciproducens]MDY3615746.1 restriction endonuclease subunit S [Intestinimonas butyriciproducens]
MTPEIKQRIEQLRHGNVPEGYKKGKLGIVPQEWEETSFSSLFTSTSDYTDNLTSYPLYSLTIEDGITAKTERYERSHLVKKENSYKVVCPNDYAYNPMNIRFGAVARHKGSFPVAVSGYYNIFTTNHESDLAFMDSFLTCGSMITYYNKVSTGSLTEKQRVHFSEFIEFSFPLPDFEERKKIAAILTTQDKVIELKEKLLAEKQRQKKYLMQQLLTGKKRLPGFGGEWKTERLGKLFAERTEIKRTDLPLLAITAGQGILPRDQLDLKDNSSEDKSKYLRICPGDIGYNTMRMWQGVSAYSEYEGIVSPAYTILKPSDRIEAKYFAYLFKMPDIIFLFYRFSQGLVDDTRNLKYENFKKIKVRYPSEKKEQAAIVQILSTADREIELLQKEIEAEKQKKKALMQLLLTGIVRVKV